jgi:hypothetical protein
MLRLPRFKIMKVASRVARVWKPAPGENLTHSVIFERPVRRFDTHGSASFVLQDIERNVPLVFGTQGEKALTRLRRLVRNYTNNEPWPYLVASLTSGMPRRELEGFLSRDIGHAGPVVIAPDTARKPWVFTSEAQAMDAKERLTRAAEKSHGMMFILYGIDNPTLQKEYEIYRNQLRRVDGTLMQILEEDSRLRSARGIARMDEELLRRLRLLGRTLQDASQHITGLDSNDVQTDPHGDLYRSLMVIQNMEGSTTLDNAAVQRMVLALGIIPARYAELGLTQTSAAGPDTAVQNEAQATMERQENQAIDRQRSALRMREARADRTADSFQDEDERLQALEANARTPQEREHYRRQRANLEEQQRSDLEDEGQIEIRERRHIQNEEQARIGTEGAAEGRYVPLSTDEHQTAVSQEQRRQFALQERRAGEREGRLENEYDTRSPVYENRAPSEQAVEARRAEQPSREDVQKSEQREERQAEENLNQTTAPGTAMPENEVPEEPRREVVNEARNQGGAHQEEAPASDPKIGTATEEPSPKG